MMPSCGRGILRFQRENKGVRANERNNKNEKKCIFLLTNDHETFRNTTAKLRILVRAGKVAFIRGRPLCS